MDAMKLLGSLLKNQSLSSGLGQQLLGGLLGGGQSRQQSSAGGGLAGILGSVLGAAGNPLVLKVPEEPLVYSDRFLVAAEDAKLLKLRPAAT